MSNQLKKVGFIGLGKLGLTCAEVMADHYDVTGYDIYPRESAKITISDTLEGAVRDKDIIFVDSMEIMDERIALKLKDLKN